MATNKNKLPAENCDKRSLWSYVRLSVCLSVRSSLCLSVCHGSVQFDHVVDHVCWRGAFGPHSRCHKAVNDDVECDLSWGGSTWFDLIQFEVASATATYWIKWLTSRSPTPASSQLNNENSQLRYRTRCGVQNICTPCKQEEEAKEEGKRRKQIIKLPCVDRKWKEKRTYNISYLCILRSSLGSPLIELKWTCNEIYDFLFIGCR